MTTLTFTVDDSGLVRAFRETGQALAGIIDRVAEDFAEAAADEAGQSSSRLGQPWIVEGSGPAERHVSAPEWWAHFIAGGTASHGPAHAERLVFSVGGNTVFARGVRGIPGDPFDVRALDRTRARVDDILRQAIAEASV